MKIPSRAIVYLLLFTAVLTRNAAAQDLVQDSYFQALTYSKSATLPLTTLFGQFGTDTGSTLTLANWNTTGYNFVYAPNTADAGTSTGANTNAPNEAPGEYNAANKYGDTYMWGSNNGGLSTLPATDPAGGNFIAADGAFQTGPITQMITGLTVGKFYALNFYWAAAQQQKFTGITTEQWQVTLGGQTAATSVVTLPSKSFSGWMQQTYYYTASSTMELLSFLAVGMPSGEPPFVLLGGVTLDQVPEPSTWALFAGIVGVCVVYGVVRRRRGAIDRASGLD